MKNFIIRVILFCVSLGIINLLLLRIVNNAYFKDYEKVDLNYKTYLLSDSHGLCLRSKKGHSGFYNFSAGGESFYDMKRKLKFLIRNTQVQQIIITVDDHTLSNYKNNANNLDRSSYFSEYKDFENRYDFIKNKYLKRYIPLLSSKSRDIVFTYLEAKFFRKEKKKKPIWYKLSYDEQSAKSLKRVQTHYPEPYLSNELRMVLNDMINLCKVHDIKLIGIKYPLSQNYLNLLQNKTTFADSLFYKNNIRVYDFKTAYRKNDTLFSDHDHMNRQGGVKFESELMDILDKYDYQTNN